LSYFVPGQKLGGGATGHAKRAGKKSNINSKINLKTTVELKMFSHFGKFWLN
jgi:hypothetical protein